MTQQSGKSFKMLANDVSDGYITVNPLFLKNFNESGLKSLLKAVEQKQIELRSEPFPYNDVSKIRHRNLRLQRLHSATVILKNYAREKRILLI